MSYAAPFRRNWSVLWRIHGKPTLSIIEPISEWTVAAGVEYDAHHDQFVDEEGAVVAVAWAGQPSNCYGFLPARQANDVTLSIPGVATTTAIERNVVLLWCEAAQAAVAAAWGVVIGGELYRVKAWVLSPEGVAQPIEIQLSLVEA